MRLIRTGLLWWSCLGLSALSLQAKNFDLSENSLAQTNDNFSFSIEKYENLFKEKTTKSPKRKWTVERIAKKISKEKYPLLALYQIWNDAVERVEYEHTTKMKISSPLVYLNHHLKCSPSEYTQQFIKLCHLLGIDSRQANVQGKTVYDFCLRGDDWFYLDLSQGQFFLGWDNQTLVSSENLMDDPLLVLRSKTSREQAYSLKESWQALAQLNIINFEMQEKETFNSDLDETESKDSALILPLLCPAEKILKSTNDFKRDQIKQPSIKILNESGTFDLLSPIFHLAANENCLAEKIRWQISLDKEFKVIPFNFEGVQAFNPSLTLSLLDETFLNANDTYYLRIQGYKDEQWSDWSLPFAFSVNKPQSVNLIEFNEIHASAFELNWEREAEALDGSIEYLIFGSNAFDFIPSLYSSTQINEIAEGQISNEEMTDNLIAITTDAKFVVDGSLAYYRIIARKQDQLSVPSPIIHVYGANLIQPRTLVQIIEESDKMVAKRQFLPSTYPWTETALPRLGVMNRLYDNSLLELHTYISSTMLAKEADPLAGTPIGYAKPSHMSKELWKKMQPYFLPENHPWKSKIDRIFSASRASKNSHELLKAGFRGRVTSVRKIFAGVHPDLADCFFKIYADSEVTSRYTEWQKWLDRIRGRNNVLKVIKNRGFEKWFSVPDKWVYPLPEKPSAPSPSSRYRPKDFILVATNQRPYDHHENEKLWRNKITHEMLDALYIVLDEAGMWDSMFIFNIPFSKIDGKICFVDTEYSHKWPLRFEKLLRYLSTDNKKYWEYLIKHHGPKGYKRTTPLFK